VIQLLSWFIRHSCSVDDTGFVQGRYGLEHVLGIDAAKTIIQVILSGNVRWHCLHMHNDCFNIFITFITNIKILTMHLLQ